MVAVLVTRHGTHHIIHGTHHTTHGTHHGMTGILLIMDIMAWVVIMVATTPGITTVIITMVAAIITMVTIMDCL